MIIAVVGSHLEVVDDVRTTLQTAGFNVMFPTAKQGANYIIALHESKLKKFITINACDTQLTFTLVKFIREVSPSRTILLKPGEKDILIDIGVPQNVDEQQAIVKGILRTFLSMMKTETKKPWWRL